MSSDLGDPKTNDDLNKASDTPQFKNGLPTEYWVKLFHKKNPEIVLRIPKSISRAA